MSRGNGNGWFRWRQVGVVAALAVTAVCAGANPASAAPATVTGGSIQWGVKASFRTYIVGPIAQGTVGTSGGATQSAGNGVFQFGVTGGSHDGSTVSAASTGAAIFTGHHGELETTVSDVRVSVNGTTGSIIADVSSREFTDLDPNTPAAPLVVYDDVTLGTLDLTSVAPSLGAGTVTYTNVPAVLAPSGVPALGNFYDAGTDLDPISFTLQLDGTPGGGGTTARPITTGSLRWTVSQSAWETSASTTSLNECLGVLAPATIVAGAWNSTTAGAVFGSSEGTYDPATGALALASEGTVVIGNVSRGNYRIRFVNPVLVVGADGTGTLSADVQYSLTPAEGVTTTDCFDERAWTTLVEDVELVGFDADASRRTVDGDNVAWSFVPRWAEAVPAHQFSPELLAALADAQPALQPWFMATGNPVDPTTAANVRKVAAPIYVSFSLAPPPPSASVDIVATVPVDGALVISVANNTVTLPPFALSSNAQVLTAAGALGSVTVTDTRATNPGWNVNAQLTDFVGDAGSIAGSGLGWTPSVTGSSIGQVVTPGASVASGAGVNGATLASAASGAGRGTALLGAEMVLQAPTSAQPGTYAATLTLTTI